MIKILGKDKAFTLVELVVTISIIAVLTAITLYSLSSSRSKARDGQRLSDISRMQQVLSAYYERCNHQYPNPNPGTDPNANGYYGDLSHMGSTDNNGCPAGVSLKDFIYPLPVAPSYSRRYTATDCAHDIDPCANYTYYYSVNQTSSVYILHVSLENSSDLVDGSMNDTYARTLTGAYNRYQFRCAGNAKNAEYGIIDYCIGPN